MGSGLSGAVRAIDRLNAWTGNAVAWLTLGMVVLTLAVVVLRYAFDVGMVWLQDSITWMHAAVFMLGAAATLQRGEHVRVDIFYRRMGPRGRAAVDLAGVLLLLLPFSAFVAFEALDYVAASWSLREGARDAGGLSWPAVPLLKSLLLLMPLAVALQGVSMALSAVQTLRGS